MKTSLSLSLIVAGFGALTACSSDEGDDRNAGGTGSSLAGTGGQVGVAGTSSGGAGGTSSGGGAGGGDALPAMGSLGEPLTITTEGVVDTANGTNINGGIAVTQSATQEVDPTIELRANGLCFKGTTATVPDANSYGTHWGAEMILDLNRGANPDAPTGDAGADAGGADAGGPVLGQVAQDWPQGNVIGFSYRLVGNDTAAADQGVPPAQVRFKATPVGAVPADDNYCSSRTPTSGTRENVLFSDVIFECWNEGNYSLADDPIQYVQDPDPKVVGTRENPRAFRNISWQISSDVMVPPIAYDFCVTDLRPILAP
jgi:hypothetical protein